MPSSKKREHFSSGLATILTMVGVAVGLGNVWRFPYMMGSHGGSAFLVVYLLFVLVFGIPAVMGEWALGRETRRGPLGAFSAAFGGAGRWVGWVLLVNVTIANSYYLVIISQLGYSAAYSAAIGFPEGAVEAFEFGREDPTIQVPIMVGLILASLVVLGRGIVRGVERASVVLVPFFGLVVVYMVFHSLSLDGVLGRLGEFLRPDFSRMTPKNIFAAMGQAFFSLSLGGTFFLIYGSHLHKKERIQVGAVWTAVGDVGASLLAALFIVPTVLVFGLDLESGPDLIFKTFPLLFDRMVGGRVVGTLFLFALTSVAFLSSLAAMQVLLGALIDSFAMNRLRALVLIGVVTATLALPSIFSPGLIRHLDLICGSGMQCLGSGLALLALTWGLGRGVAMKQLFTGRAGVWAALLFFWLRWGVPLALAATLFNYVRTQN